MKSIYVLYEKEATFLTVYNHVINTKLVVEYLRFYLVRPISLGFPTLNKKRVTRLGVLLNSRDHMLRRRIRSF